MRSKTNNVCCRNIQIVLRYCERHGVDGTKLLTGLAYPPVYLKDPEHWIPLKVFSRIVMRAKELLNDPEAPYKMGLSSAELQSWGSFAHLQRILATSFFGPGVAMPRVPKYNENFNDTKTMELIDLSRTSCRFGVTFHPHIDPVDDYDSGAFIRGIYAAIPQVWGLPAAEVSEVLLEYKLDRLFTKLFEAPGRPRTSGNIFFLGRTRYGRQVELLPETIKGRMWYLGRFRELARGKTPTHPLGVLIERDLTVESLPVLRTGQIFEAPSFVIHVKWQEPSIVQRIRNLTLGTWLSRRAYLEGLEEEINAVQRYTKELETMVERRTAALSHARRQLALWRRKASRVLYSQVPQEIAEAMVKRRLKAREVIATVLFLDLSGFTAHMGNAEAEAVASKLRAFFTEAREAIEQEHGWVNKYLGDGLMAIFGGMRRDDDPHASARSAVLSALRLQRIIERYPWKLRAGLETGPVLMGEIGPERDRRFDVLGQTVNKAKRLEEEASAGGLLLGGQIAALIRRDYPVERLGERFLKGIGSEAVYTIRGQKLGVRSKELAVVEVK